MDEEKSKEERAKEIDRAIKAANKRAEDAEIDPGRERRGESEGEGLDKMLSHLDSAVRKLDDVGRRMDRLDARLDALERKRGDDDDDDDARRHRDDALRRDRARGRDDDDDARRRKDAAAEQPGPEPGKPNELIADARRRGRRDDDDDVWRPTGSETAEKFADVQMRADNAAAQWGGRAPAPMIGETLRAYRQRLIRPYQKYSDVYKNTDLAGFPEVAFAEAEKAIYADAAVAATRDDLVPEGMLRMITERTPSGHTKNRFIGHPSAWMCQFMPVTRRYMTRLNPQGAKDFTA